MKDETCGTNQVDESATANEKIIDLVEKTLRMLTTASRQQDIREEAERLAGRLPKIVSAMAPEDPNPDPENVIRVSFQGEIATRAKKAA